jgi:hypothetical protein
MKWFVLAVMMLASAVPRAETAQRCAISGTWAGTGDDTAGIHWTFTLELGEQDGKVRGTFHWKSKSYAGDEEVRGTINCAAHTMSLTGVTSNGSVGTAVYTLALDDKLASFRGDWKCPRGDNCGAPGTLAATKR